MSEINCVSCGAKIDSASRTCSYCGVVVSDPSMSAPTVRMSREAFNNMGRDPGQSDLLDEVRELALSGKKIEAIKRYREITDVGLAEAKEAVEAMESGFPVASAGATMISSGVPHSRFNSSAEAMDEIKRLLREGNKIEAIKTHREYFDMGLAESKNAVEAIESQLKFESAPAMEDSGSAQTMISSGSLFGGSDSTSAQTMTSNEPAISPNPFDEQVAAPKKNNWVRWVVGCGVALLLFCCCLGVIAAVAIPQLL